MRHLKKPVVEAQAIQHLDEDDEMDDMPFVVSKNSRRGGKKQQAPIQVV